MRLRAIRNLNLDMSKIIDEIYQSVALNMVDNLPGNWISAFLKCQRDAADAIGFSGGYSTGDAGFTSFKFRNFDRRMIQDFHDLHAITTEGGKNRWNLATFTLSPEGKFSIDFAWDQAIADEVASNS